MKRLASSVLLLFALGTSLWAGGPTALDDYVAKPDAAYQWKKVKSIDGLGYTAYILDLTSQRWPKATNQEVWRHYVQVIVPAKVTSKTAFLLVEGGSTSSTPPDKVDPIAMAAATQAQTISVCVPNVPNQPLTFADEDFKHSEDGMVCYTFDKFLSTGDRSWPAYLPMVNSAVRAMDAAQEFVATLPGELRVEDFVVAGGSKRGWTAWLTGAVDPKKRVKAIIPVVADLANLAVQMDYHRQVFQGVTTAMKDGYSVALGDFLHYNVIGRFPTPEGKALLEIIDPYSYFDRPVMQMPKYLVYGASDEYFTPGSANNYFDKLQGPSYLWYVPNAGHKLNFEAIQGIVSFYQAIVRGARLPQFDWHILDDGHTIRVHASDAPRQVLLWQAHNPESRDFRLAIFGQHWTSSPLSDQGDGVYEARMSAPETGGTAFYLELAYDVSGTPLKFSSSISILSPK